MNRFHWLVNGSNILPIADLRKCFETCDCKKFEILISQNMNLKNLGLKGWMKVEIKKFDSKGQENYKCLRWKIWNFQS